MFYFSRRSYLLITLTMLSILAVFIVPSIAQPLSYHDFADKRDFLHITNCLNVISNIAFIFAGIYGLQQLSSKYKRLHFYTKEETYIYYIFFISSILIGLGSSYYHLNPNNTTLFWDRLPMSILFMSYCCAILSERVNKRLGLRLLVPLIILGILSVVHWEYTELVGRGDLRLYAWSQAYPTIMIVVAIFLYRSYYTHSYLIFIDLICYVIAKLSEFLDKGIFNLTMHLISGHTLKHLAAALAIYFIARYICLRRKLV